MLTERINTLRERALRFRRPPNTEWDQLYHASLAQTEGLAAPLRTARALENCFRQCTVAIHAQELIAGDSVADGADEAPRVNNRFIFGHASWRSPWPDFSA